MTSVTNALTTIAQPTRQQILRLVWDAERCAGDIAAAMPVTFGAVSQHLHALRDAGLVTMRPDGKRRWYKANREALGPLAAALEAMWSDKLGELKRLAEREQRTINESRQN
jgi:DNA-binding transcriptional ArsR family regulator